MSADPHSRYETVIGLEVHVQLATASKLFSPAPVSYGADPNHSVRPMDLALPGVLPVLNGHAVDLAIRVGLALSCEIHPTSIFARKHYWYPDLPKGYQISQYEEPLATDGSLEIETGEGGARKRIGITRIHMEEDAGKSVHEDAIAGAGATHVDLNRCGVPLVEIVSEPDLRSAAEAGAYLRALREILRYVEVSRADLEKGQFRCDANVSLRARGETRLGTRTELKNLNSFRFVEEGIRFEVKRQAKILDDGGVIQQATLHFDAKTGRARATRVKENADDYRYFPDPDLVPLVVEPARIEALRSALPELPDARRRRFAEEYGLSDYDARVLTATRQLADFFEATVKLHGDAKTVANWASRDLLQALKEVGLALEDASITPQMLASLIQLVDSKRVTAASARQLVPELVKAGGEPESLVKERGLEAVADEGVLEAAVSEVVAAHPDVALQYRAGNEKSLNFLMGQVMKRMRGRANPAAVRDLLQAKLDA